MSDSSEMIPSNPFSDALDKIAHLFAEQGALLHGLQKAVMAEATVTERKLTPGNDVMINFQATSIYIDNSQGANAISIQKQGSMITHTVAAGAQQWVYPLGGNFFTVTGEGTAYAMFTDQLIK